MKTYVLSAICCLLSVPMVMADTSGDIDALTKRFDSAYNRVFKKATEKNFFIDGVADSLWPSQLGDVIDEIKLFVEKNSSKLSGGVRSIRDEYDSLIKVVRFGKAWYTEYINASESAKNDQWRKFEKDVNSVLNKRDDNFKKTAALIGEKKWSDSLKTEQVKKFLHYLNYKYLDANDVVAADFKVVENEAQGTKTTTIEILKNDFDDAFKATFETKKNILMIGNFVDKTLVKSVNEIGASVQNDYSQFDRAWVSIVDGILSICDLPETLIRKYSAQLGLRNTKAKEGSPKELVMLTFKDWNVLRDMAEGTFKRVQGQFKEANDLLKEKKSVETSGAKAMRKLLQDMIYTVETRAFGKIIHGFEDLRDDTKMKKYASDQAPFVLKNLENIYDEVNDVRERWHKMTNEVGLALGSSADEVINKFDKVGKETSDNIYAAYRTYLAANK